MFAAVRALPIHSIKTEKRKEISHPHSLMGPVISCHPSSHNHGFSAAALSFPSPRCRRIFSFSLVSSLAHNLNYRSWLLSPKHSGFTKNKQKKLNTITYTWSPFPFHTRRTALTCLTIRHQSLFLRQHLFSHPNRFFLAIPAWCHRCDLASSVSISCSSFIIASAICYALTDPRPSTQSLQSCVYLFPGCPRVKLSYRERSLVNIISALDQMTVSSPTSDVWSHGRFHTISENEFHVVCTLTLFNAGREWATNVTLCT